MNANTYRIVSTIVWTLQARQLPYFFDIIVQNSENSHLEQAKIV